VCQILDPVDPLIIGLLDPDNDPYYFSKDFKKFKKGRIRIGPDLSEFRIKKYLRIETLVTTENYL
jgi:hypothetical protein